MVSNANDAKLEQCDVSTFCLHISSLTEVQTASPLTSPRGQPHASQAPCNRQPRHPGLKWDGQAQQCIQPCGISRSHVDVQNRGQGTLSENHKV